jgi:metal-responsive CopG/Arc/MetJ family transcriptional regulator
MSDTPTMEIMNLRIPLPLLEKIERTAEQNHLTKSEVVRLILRSRLEPELLLAK